MKHTNRDPERKHSFSGLCLLYNFTISDLLWASASYFRMSFCSSQALTLSGSPLPPE